MESNKNILWNRIKNNSKNIEAQMDPLERKRTGSYFTDLDLTDIMMHELVQHLLAEKKDISKCTFLEPCVGTGNFVFSYLREISKLALEQNQYFDVLQNLYVADINKKALSEYRMILMDFAKIYWDIRLDDQYFEKHIGSGLLIDVSQDEPKYISLGEVFSESVAKKRFDIVVTNPPYKNLKAERGQYTTDEEYEADKDKYASISKIVNKKFMYSANGVLNLYKLFVEEIIDAYGNNNAYVSLLIPSSILSDKTCQRLRTHILEEKCLISVKVIGEGSGYIDAQQALCAVLLKKGCKTKKIEMTKDFCLKPEEKTVIMIEDILNENTGNAIIAINESEYRTLKKLRKFPVIKELDFIVNLRGELDLTANKKAITQTDTGYPMLRGRNIGYYEILNTDEHEFASIEFVNSTKKKCYIEDDRIICQQIANMHKERRVTFAFVPKNFVLGNSCNFISVKPNPYGIDIYALLGLFNTKIINRFFKLTSSNNHINNYEIDGFPVPIHSCMLTEISELSKKYLESKDEAYIERIERCAQEAYGIIENEETIENEILRKFHRDICCIIPSVDFDEAEKVINGESELNWIHLAEDKFTKNVIHEIIKKYRAMYKNVVLNHSTFKLSDLDLEMIRSVPQGGSWKDIPGKTVEKSKRLMRITETGGRTTLYGRIDYDKPSYTITTYFNRPGNGTYVHPVHERVLSVREAARFQCFTDDYYFYGNKIQLLKQVGNAVPTVLAYQLAKKIVDNVECSKSIDLFCGAGGLTAGFKAAGIKSMLSNDIEESACTTLKINNPEIEVFCGDITKEETKNKIVATAKEKGVDIICGGPPCQGFSMAGLRLTDDPRNQLFKDFVDVVSRTNPKVVVFENVEGLLSYQGGRIYQAIHNMFSEIGYNTEGRILMANEYAVPQKRKRVIIICVRKDLKIDPSNLYPDPITLSSRHQITARETIEDLEKVACSDDTVYLREPHSDIVKFFRGQMTYDEYIKRHTFSDSAEESDSMIEEENTQLKANFG